MSRQQNIKCFLDTQQLSRSYKVPKTTSYTYDDISEDLKTYENTEIQVCNNDCIAVAQTYAEQEGSVCLLNMASAWKAGGGVATGSSAQEETICRRSNLYSSLEKMEYPMPEHVCYMTKDVTFFKDDEHSNYQLYDNPFQIDVISMAAYKISGKGPTDIQMGGMLTKIKLLLLAAASNGNDTLILSALGCGAYGWSATVVSELFWIVLVEENLKKYFKTIVFAIIDDHNTKKEGNFAPFEKTFRSTE